MEEYLKMSDVFGGAITISSGCRERLISHGGEVVATSPSPSVAKYATHAINSHDELVQMNKELLAALDWSDSQIMEFISMAFRHAEIKGDFELSDVRDALNVISSKAKGGAA